MDGFSLNCSANISNLNITNTHTHVTKNVYSSIWLWYKGNINLFGNDKRHAFFAQLPQKMIFVNFFQFTRLLLLNRTANQLILLWDTKKNQQNRLLRKNWGRKQKNVSFLFSCIYLIQNELMLFIHKNKFGTSFYY